MMGKFKENIRKIENIETMPIPEVEVKREQGIELLSGFLSEQKQPLKDNFEAIEMIALTYGHPEWKDEILNQIKKYKEFIKNPEELYKKTIKSLREYEKNAPFLNMDEEIKKREEMVLKYKEQIKKSIEYFRPDPKTSDIKNIEIIPCDEVLSSKNTGRGFRIGSSRFIMSHTLNPDNFDHEFLHGIINPITEKFESYFEGEEQKQKILKFVAGGLKSYGDYPVSILNEEIINTYNEYIKEGGKKDTFSDFEDKLKNLTEEDFEKYKEKDSNVQKLLDELNIKTLENLKSNSEIFYRRFPKKEPKIKNELRKRLVSFYKEYESEKELDKFLSFEKYFSENFKKILG